MRARVYHNSNFSCFSVSLLILPKFKNSTPSSVILIHWSTKCNPGIRNSSDMARTPRVNHCHWSVYLCNHHSDAGEVEEGGSIDTSGGGAYDVHTWSRN